MSDFLSDREKEEDILFLDTVQQHKGQNDYMQLIQIVMNKFRFGHGGWNGYFENASELFDELQEWIEQERL